MTRSLPNKPNISLLKKQAKKLLKQVREGDVNAVASVNSNHPKPDSFASLRDAQLVIARSYGFTDWNEIKDAIELAVDSDKNLSEKAALFIQLGCVQYSGNDLVKNYQRAHKLLAAFPEIAAQSFYSALVASNATVVTEYLEANANLALTPGGPLEWPPLMYVTYSRINDPENSQRSLSIAKQLLEYGADSNSHVILDDTYRFTALTGAMGEGEQGVNQPAHQYADEMAALLLDAGANPNEGQGLYNTMFTNSADKWLALLINKGLKPTDPLNWGDPDNDTRVSTLDYQLASAVDGNRDARVRLLLEAGANPNTRNTYNSRAIHTNALLANNTEIAQLLEDNGAIPQKLDLKDEFTLACVRDDNAAITSMLNAHPALKEDATLLHAAAEHANLEMVLSLIAQGFDINGQSKYGRTLLHNFAMNNHTKPIIELLKLDAKTDIRDQSHNSLALGFAAYNASYDAMRLLLDVSDSLLDVVCCAYLDRAKILVQKKPDSIHYKTENGNTVLHIAGFWLHEEPEYDSYKALVEWLLLAGADINAKNKQGQTPIEFNLAHGSETLAELLSEHS